MGIANAVERLRNFWIFAELSDQDLAYIGGLLLEKQARADQVLFAQGEPPDFFYLVESGAIREEGVDESGGTVLRRTVEPGGFLGHWSPMHNQRRRATATVQKSARLLALSTADLIALLTMYPSLRANLARTDVIARLLAIPLFRHFSEAQLEHVADLLTVVEHPPQQTIFRQGEKADRFYVVDRGQVLVGDRYVTAGNFFGQEGLPARHGIRRQTATAQSEVRLFCFPRDAFHWLGEWQPAFQQEIRQFDIQEYLQQATEFSHCTTTDHRLLAGYVGLARYRQGDILYHQGEFDPTLYFLYEGAVVASAFDQQTKQTTYHHLRAGANGIGFGQSALFLEEPRDATVQATTETLLLYLHRTDYEHLVAAAPDIEERLNLRPEVQERKQIKPVSWMAADEHILFRRRRHGVVLTMRLLPAVLLLLIFAALLLIHLPGDLQSILRCLRPILIGMSLLWVVWRYVDWQNDYYTVTNQRAVHEEKVLFIQETREEAPLSKIQNVNVSQDFLGHLLGYGKLAIETAVKAEVSNLVFDYLDHPEEAQRLILEQTRRVQASETLETQRAIREKLEASVGGALKPQVPKPVIPWPPERTATEPGPPSLWARLAEATWQRWFWIKKEQDGQITWRKHWIRLVWRVGWPTAFLILWSALAFVAWPGSQELHWGLAGLWVVGFIGLAFWWWWGFENWGNDLYSVTNDRVIDIEALPLGFHSKRTETMFDRIQNVSYEIPNFIATLLNYGTVIISTAGAEGTLNFVYVRDPKGVQAEIFRRLAAYEDLQRRRQREAQWANLPDWFAEYDRLRQG